MISRPFAVPVKNKTPTVKCQQEKAGNQIFLQIREHPSTILSQNQEVKNNKITAIYEEVYYLIRSNHFDAKCNI